MKMLVYRVATATGEPFYLDRVKQHLRIDGDHDDDAVRDMAWTAVEEIEHFAQVALLKQTIRVSIFGPDLNASWLRLPIGPVLDDGSVCVSFDGASFTGFELERGHRPALRWNLRDFDTRQPRRISIEYEAGFGSGPDSIPRDLAQAVMDQAGVLYDGRTAMDAKTLSASPHMARVGARYRGVSL